MMKRRQHVSARKPKASASGTDVPVRIESTLTQRTRFGEFLHQWQEPVVWVPLLIGLLLILFYALPRLDPRTGIDGFGDTFHLVIRALVLAVTVFSVWLIKKTYLTVLDENKERELFDDWRRGDRGAFKRLVFDRVEWFLLIGGLLWYFGR
jgi:Ni,Fe-hydrogenase I cytochrome b subunit